MTDYYKILGISRDANSEEIRKAYRSRAKHMHPDVSSSGSANTEFALVNEAYSVLSDPDKKRKYDLRLAYGDYYLVNSVFTHNGQRSHAQPVKKHPDPRYRQEHTGEPPSGQEHSSYTYRPEYHYSKRMDPFIFNLFFSAGMFIGFLMIFLTIAFVYVRMWPYVFLLMTIPGVILVKEGWKGIARIKTRRKKRTKK